MLDVNRIEYMEYMIEENIGLSAATILLNAHPSLPRPRGYADSRPYDNGDVGRCHELLTMFPELYATLPGLVDKYPEWSVWVGLIMARAEGGES